MPVNTLDCKLSFMFLLYSLKTNRHCISFRNYTKLGNILKKGFRRGSSDNILVEEDIPLKENSKILFKGNPNQSVEMEVFFFKFVAYILLAYVQYCP